MKRLSLPLSARFSAAPILALLTALAAALLACQTGKPAVEAIPVFDGLLDANAPRDRLASVMVIDEGIIVRSARGQAVNLPRRQQIRLAPGDWSFGFAYQWYMGTRDGVDAWGSMSGMVQRKFNPGDQLLLHATDLGGTREVTLSPLLYKPHANAALATNLVGRGNEAKAMVFVPGSDHVAVAGSKGMIEILAAPNTRLVANIRTGAENIVLLAPGTKAGHLWAADATNAVWDVDVGAGKALRLFQAAHPILDLGGGPGTVSVAGPNAVVETRDAYTGTLLGNARGLEGTAETLFAASGGWLQYQGDMVLWQGPTAAPPRAIRLDSPVLKAGIHPGNSLIVTALKNGHVLIWRQDSGIGLDLGSYVFNQSSFNPVMAVGFSRDGGHLQLVSFANRLYFWDLDDLVRDVPRFVYNQYAGSDLLINYSGGSGSRVELQSDLEKGIVAYRLFDKGFSTVVVDRYR